MSSVALIDWRPYSGMAAIVLGLVLLCLAAGFFLLGSRKRSASPLPNIGKAWKAVILLVWVLSILLVLPLFKQVAADTGQSALGTGPVLPITLASAAATFVAVAYVTRAGGALAALGSGFAGAVAGPMVFELPFVLIITPDVTTRVPHPLFMFSVFLLVILTTLTLPTFSRRFSVNRYSLSLLGAMLAVFALWAFATGYAPPGDPTSFILNAVSKVLAFGAVGAGFISTSEAPPPRDPGQAL